MEGADLAFGALGVDALSRLDGQAVLSQMCQDVVSPVVADRQLSVVPQAAVRAGERPTSPGRCRTSRQTFQGPSSQRLNGAVRIRAKIAELLEAGDYAGAATLQAQRKIPRGSLRALAKVVEGTMRTLPETQGNQKAVGQNTAAAPMKRRMPFPMQTGTS